MAISTMIFCYSIPSIWGFKDILAPSLIDFEKKNARFYSAFWSIYPKLRKKAKNTMPKFMLYYMAQRGYITIDIDSENVVRILRTPAESRANAAEKFLLNSLFGNPELIEYVSENAVMGQESVSLSKVGVSYLEGIKNCPFDASVRKMRKPTGKSIIDYPSYIAANRRFMTSSVLIALVSFFPAALYESMESSPIAIIGAFYFVTALFMLAFGLGWHNLGEILGSKHIKTLYEAKNSIKLQNVPIANASTNSLEDEITSGNTDEENNDSENSPATDTVILETVYVNNIKAGKAEIPVPTDLASTIRFFSLKTLHDVLENNGHSFLSSLVNFIRGCFWGNAVFFGGIFIIAFGAVTGNTICQHSYAYGIILIVIMYILKSIRNINSEKNYSISQRDTISYIKFLKKAFTPKRLAQNMVKPKQLTYLIPYAALLNETKTLNEYLPQNKECVPNWITQSNEMSFAEIDNVIDNTLKDVPLLRN